ncbi:hypothetical protein RB595_006802 [Gaeumannomyces hyphopodioides]
MGRPRLSQGAAAVLLLAASLQTASAQYYKIDTLDAIKQSAKTLAYDMMLMYPGNKTGQEPGILPGPPTENKGDYYWWQGGALMGTMIDYWHLTGDTEYNKIISEGILNQVGEGRDFQPAKHRASLGNDDQGFWGMTAMLAAENKFPDPPKDQPQWLALAQAVWTTQAAPERHDNTCNGGMRWQVPPTNAGYDYKNTIANGCFFNIGARLARYTGNKTYAEHAEKTFDWLYAVNYIDHETYKVYDGGHVNNNCTDIHKAQFSYNIAVLLEGCAFMYNYTDGGAIWKDRVEKLTDSIFRDFFADGAAYELPCEQKKGGCTADMLSFKGYVHRWLSVASQVAPFIAPKIRPVLRKSAEMAVKQCTGGATGRACGFYWTGGEYVDPAIDKTSGAGERMNVLAAVSSLLIDQAAAPVTNSTGGTSAGDPLAGTIPSKDRTFKEITTGDRAGAGILTMLLLGSATSTFGWMSWDR